MVVTVKERGKRSKPRPKIEREGGGGGGGDPPGKSKARAAMQTEAQGHKQQRRRRAVAPRNRHEAGRKQTRVWNDARTGRGGGSPAGRRGREGDGHPGVGDGEGDGHLSAYSGLAVNRPPAATPNPTAPSRPPRARRAHRDSGRGSHPTARGGGETTPARAGRCGNGSVPSAGGRARGWAVKAAGCPHRAREGAAARRHKTPHHAVRGGGGGGGCRGRSASGATDSRMRAGASQPASCVVVGAEGSWGGGHSRSWREWSAVARGSPRVWRTVRPANPVLHGIKRAARPLLALTHSSVHLLQLFYIFESK